MPKFTPISVHDLGEYLREQRQSAQLSLRQLSEVAGISNPYLSQIERGLKRPSAEILQALAKALRISAESLYVRAGILEARSDLGEGRTVDVTEAILADPKLNDRQRAVLLDVYESFVGESVRRKAPGVSKPTEPTEPTEHTEATSTIKATKVTKALRVPKVARTTEPSIAPSESSSTTDSTTEQNRPS